MLRCVLAIAFLLQDGLSEEEFRKLHSELQPSKDEGWRKIPWMVSLTQAQHRAAREKKPIFMWARQGNPCGMT